MRLLERPADVEPEDAGLDDESCARGIRRPEAELARCRLELERSRCCRARWCAARRRRAGAPAERRSPPRPRGTAGSPRRRARSDVFVTSSSIVTVAPRSSASRSISWCEQSWRRVREGGVARAVPERELRPEVEVEVLRRVLLLHVVGPCSPTSTVDSVSEPPHARGPAGALVRVVDRHLADRARERHRQPSGGLGIAEQHVDDRCGRLGAAVPRLDDGGGGVDPVRDDERPPVLEHDRERGPRGRHLPDQLLLPPGQAQIAARRRLTRERSSARPRRRARRRSRAPPSTTRRDLASVVVEERRRRG